MADLTDGTTREINTMFPAELRNGEGVIGYEYLHDTNQNVSPGGFQMQGKATKIKGGRTGCLQVDFEIVYRWNDRMDPNARYQTDRTKSGLARMFTTPADYDFHVRWTPRSSFLMVNGKDESAGWPLAPPKFGTAADDPSNFMQ